MRLIHVLASYMLLDASMQRHGHTWAVPIQFPFDRHVVSSVNSGVRVVTTIMVV